MSLLIHGLHLPKMLGGEEMHIDVRIFSGGDVIMATSEPPYYKKFQAEQIQEGKEEPPTPQKEPLCLSCANASFSVTDDFADCLCAVSGGYEGGKTECKDYERRKAE